MSRANRRVVLTGIGVVTSIGMDAASYWTGLSQGQSGIKPIKLFDPAPLETRIAGEISNFDPKPFLSKENRKHIRVMARPIQHAVVCAQLALDDAKVDKTKLDPTRFGVDFGAGLIPSELFELGEASVLSVEPNSNTPNLKVWGEKGIPAIQPLWMLKYLPNMLACHVSILHNAQGPSNSITESDVGGILALGEAMRILQRDQSDIFFAGGTDSKITPLSMIRQQIFGHLSKRNDAPTKAIRPFDRQRDGLVIGEGGAVFIVEDLAHAQNRGAAIYAELVGFGSAFDRGLTGKGIARAIRIALDQAKLKPDDIDHINAHGMSTIEHDAWEARGINEVFGTTVPVWAVSPNIGDLGAGSGPAELTASLLAMKHGTLPPTLNYETPDPACPVKVLTKAQPITKPHFVKVSYTEMGQCAAIVCRKW